MKANTFGQTYVESWLNYLTMQYLVTCTVLLLNCPTYCFQLMHLCDDVKILIISLKGWVSAKLYLS